MNFSKKLPRWRDQLEHEMWPDDLPRPPVSSMSSPRGVVSPTSAIAGALAIVMALMGSSDQARRGGMR